MRIRGKPRLLVISQVYVPDAAAVGQYLAEAAEEMVGRGWDVVVYTSARGYEDPTRRYPATEVRRGVSIRRLPFSSFGKRSIAVRMAAQLIFLAQACVRALFAGRCDVILVSTSPPFAGFFGAVLSLVKRVPLVWWVMDLNPDQMVAARRIGAGSMVVRFFDWMNRFTIRRATAVVALDRFMAERVMGKVPENPETAAKVVVIPPWSLDVMVQGAEPESLAFRRRHGLEGKIVVMYAGNHSEQNPLETLLAATDRVRDIEQLVFVFVGAGSGKREIERRISQGATNILSLPYQPLEALAATLGSADVHVVAVGDSMVGIVHPCKIYSAMAVGRPILFFGPRSCHAADIMDGRHVGWHVQHGDVGSAETVLRQACSLSQAARQEMGERAADIIRAHYARGATLERFVRLFLPKDPEPRHDA